MISSPSAVYQASIDRVHAFVAGSDGHLYVTFWDGAEWAWDDLGTPPGISSISSPSAVYQASIDRLVVFAVGEQSLYDVFWSGAGWVWEDQGTPPEAPWISSPSAIYQASIDRLVAFVTAPDNHVHLKFWDGAGWVWEDMGTPPGVGVDQGGVPTFGRLSAVYQASIDRLVVFAVGVTQRLYDLFWSGAGWVWEDQGSPANLEVVDYDSLSAVYQASIDRLVVFAVAYKTNDSSTQHLYDKFWNGAELVWEDQGTPPSTSWVTSPSAVYQAAIDRLHVFVIGGDGHLYDKFWNGAGWVWEDLETPVGVSSVTSPSAVYQTSIDRIHVFVVGNNGRLYVTLWNGVKWVWEDLGIRPVTGPTVTLDQTRIIFGALDLGDTSPTRTIVLTNVGSGPVSISGTNLTGPNASDFEIAGDSCTGTNLDSGQNCTVGIVFSPGAAGTRHAVLTFTDSAGAQQVALQGDGIGAPYGH